MYKTSKTMASCSLEESLQRSLQRLTVNAGTTFRASLFRSKTSGKLLFLEAGKDLVDALFSFLLLSVGTIMHMLTTGMKVKPVTIGISSIFKRVQNFPVSDLQVANCKVHLTLPRAAAIGFSSGSSNLPMLSALGKARILLRPCQRRGVFGRCSHIDCQSLAATSKDTGSRGWGTGLRGKYWKFSDYSQGPYFIFEKEVDLSTVGFVKANTTFIVTDNLEIMPLTTNKSVNVLSKLNVLSLADLEGNDTTVSFAQILQLLHSALTANTCLNKVFGKRN